MTDNLYSDWLPGFLDLFQLEDVQRLQDAFAAATGVASIITKPDGTPITRPSNFCRLCNDIIRKTDKGLKNCYHSDAVLGRQNPEGPIYQKCLSGGLWDGGASITVGNRHIANWLIGQVRNEETSEEKMMDYARQIGADENAFAEALKEVTIMSTEKFRLVTDALFLFANELSQRAYHYVQLKMHRDNLELLVKAKTEDLEAAIEDLHIANEELSDKNQIINEQNAELKSALENLKQTQNQLIQSEKMASLGILTAGVAHEINNPLNFIMGAYVGLEDYFNSVIPEHKENVNLLLKGLRSGLNKASEIVRGLNQFSRDSKKYDEDCDIRSILENCLVMLYNQYKNQISLEKDYTENLPVIKGNVGELHQVFINILVNAIQAIENKGVIAIKTYIYESKIVISVTDSGNGIRKEDLNRITDPFFTTRAPGKGTGLGLAISYNIVNKHRGTMEFESEQGKGTTVRILLPIS